jgi:hypothetical protein
MKLATPASAAGTVAGPRARVRYGSRASPAAAVPGRTSADAAGLPFAPLLAR